jgi:4-hydroxybenzoate polyprenyltransferase
MNNNIVKTTQTYILTVLTENWFIVLLCFICLLIILNIYLKNEKCKHKKSKSFFDSSSEFQFV